MPKGRKYVLNARQVALIRRNNKTHEYSFAELGRMFDVSAEAIRRIARNLNYTTDPTRYRND